MDPILRRALAATAVLNILCSITFTLAGQALRAAFGIPEAHPLWTLSVVTFIFSMGLGYAALAYSGRTERTFIAVAALGKALFGALLVGMAARGELPWLAASVAVQSQEAAGQDPAVEVGAQLALDEPGHGRVLLAGASDEGLERLADDLMEERLLGLVAFVVDGRASRRDPGDNSALSRLGATAERRCPAPILRPGRSDLVGEPGGTNAP